VEGWYRPTAQPSHSVDPADAAAVPTEQLMQVVAPAAEYLPTPQAEVLPEARPVDEQK
jgi:hypothetical protein